MGLNVYGIILLALEIATMIEKYSCRVIWSDEDQEYIGLCAEFPSLSWLSKRKNNALHGIRKLVEQVIKDLKKIITVPNPIYLLYYKVERSFYFM